MNFKKSATIAATVAALAAVSVPAFAFENEFHGMYRLRGSVTNFENAGVGTAAVPASFVLNTKTGNIDPVAAKAAVPVLRKDAPTTSLFEQRARIQYTAKANADLKLVTHFEIDSSWGDGAYANGRGVGGGVGADSVNLETKNVFLDYNCPLTGANIKAGVQPFADAYKGIFLNADIAGIFASKKMGPVNTTIGFSRMTDYAGAAAIGRDTSDLFVVDAKIAASKDITVGGSYYLVRQDKTANVVNAYNLHLLGVNAAAKMGVVTADAFLAYQAGDALANGNTESAFAGQAAVKVNLAKAGTLRANVLYTTGDKNTADNKSKAWQSLNNNLGSSENSYYESKMMMLMRSVYAMDSDKSLVTTSNNGDHGLTLLAAGYDAAFTDKLGASVNVGYAMYSKKNNVINDASIGTEINGQVDYKLFSNLTASLQAAYVVLGDATKYVTPSDAAHSDKNDNPYLTALMFNYTF